MANDDSVRGKTVEKARIEARDSGRWPSSKGERECSLRAEG